MNPIKTTQSGFTLLEILIAVSIFALVSTATFTMLQQTIKTGEMFDDKAAYLVELQRTHRLFQQDFSQAVPRTIRDEFGDVLAAMMTEDVNWGFSLELTRAGWPNPLNKSRSSLQRVRYFFDGENLVRRVWKQLDRAPEAEYQDQIVLTQLETWQFRVLSNQKWLDSWPSGSESLPTELPSAIEVKLVLKNDREFRWLFSVLPQGEVK